MSERDPVLLVGNSLALLVAAAEIAVAGREVTLLTDDRSPGGHFAGVRFNDHEFDIGMVLLEKPAPPRLSPNIGEYRAEVRNDWTRFSRAVNEWLDAHGTIRRVMTPTVRLGPASGPDYLIANRLDLLRGASVAPPQPLRPSDPRHASHKNFGQAYDSLSYGEAASVNHGADLHERFIEPFVQKLLGVPSSDFLARFHRAAWVPLYYPETVHAALRGELPTLPEYGFYTTNAGFVGGIVNRLWSALKNAGKVNVVTTAVESLRLVNGKWAVSSDGSLWDSASIALGLPMERCRALLGLPSLPPPEAASVVLMFCLVRASAIGRPLSCHMLADGRGACYRLTDQDALAGLNPEWHRVVMEASSHELVSQVPSEEPIATQKVLLDELISLMHLEGREAVRVLKYLVARNALAIPTAEVVRNAQNAHAELVVRAPGAELTGALLGYGNASFNDQIVQGLRLAGAIG